MKKGLKLPKIDLKELEEEKKRILEERSNYNKRYAEWLNKRQAKK